MPEIAEWQVQRAFVFWFRGLPKKGIIGARLPGVVSWHVPNQGAGRNARQGKTLQEMGVEPGIPDYHILWGGLYVIEFKKPGIKTQSGAQDTMQGAMYGAGLVGWLTTNSVREAAAWVTAKGLVRVDATVPPFAC